MASTCGNWQKCGQQNNIMGLFVTHKGQWYTYDDLAKYDGLVLLPFGGKRVLNDP